VAERAAGRPVAEWRGVDRTKFESDIVPRGQPAILRGLVREWPAVEQGLASPAALGAYIARFDKGIPVPAIAGSSAIKGRLFYRDDMSGLNFGRSRQRICVVVDRLVRALADPDPPALCVQAIPTAEFLPGFELENRIDLIDGSVTPRLWIGNALTVAAHFDLNDNIACVVAGRRQFTLFPPDQLPNLYVGPFDFTPAGAPVSMVFLDDPDFERFPRFRDALAASQVAALEPGDAIYIPYLWWHAVKSLDDFNMLANYWWNDARPRAGSPLDVLLHASLVLRDLPAAHREAWRLLFDHYVFATNGDPLAHLAPEHRGALGGLDAEGIAAMKAVLARTLGGSASGA
jgi:hypothetical protein